MVQAVLLRASKMNEKERTRLLGERLCVYWPLDAAFYCGRVLEYDAKTTQHLLLYDDGGTSLWNAHPHRT